MDDITLQYDDRPVKEQTINSILENRSNHLGNKVFLRYGPEEEDVTFTELNEIANSIGNSLLELGVETQSNVSVMVRDPLNTVFSMFGISKAGSIYAPINFEFKGDALLYQINDTNPDALIIEDKYTERLNAITNDINDLPLIIVLYTNGSKDNMTLDDSFKSVEYNSLLHNSTSNPGVVQDWNDPASIVYTSGTTGKPKGVVLPHRWIFLNYLLPRSLLFNSDDVIHTSLPLYHIAGIYFDIMCALMTGAQVSLWDRFSPNEFWDRINKYDATAATLVSVMWNWLEKATPSENDHHNTLSKVLIVPLPDNYKKISERFGFDFISLVYGGTEAGSPIFGLINPVNEEFKTPDSIYSGKNRKDIVEDMKLIDVNVVDKAPAEGYAGRVRSFADVRIVDEKGVSLPPNETGEILIRFDEPGNLMKEYYGKYKQTVESWEDLWYHTGDAGYLDEGGNFYFVDRIGDVIRRRGENISSVQVQEIVNSHDKTAIVAAFPVPAEEGGEDEVAVAVELKEEEEMTSDELRAYLEQKMPDFMMPKYVEFVDEIPTTETNKMEKYKLKEHIRETYKL